MNTLCQRFAALLTAGLLVSAADGREQPPAIGVAKPFALPAKEEMTLANHFKATLVTFGTVPKVTIVLTIATGNIADGATTGLADLTAELMKEGAGKYDAAGAARRAADMGGTLSISAGLEETTLEIDVLAEHASEAINLIADTVRHPHLPKSELPRLKADLSRASSVKRSTARGLAAEAYAKLLWGNHPYGKASPTDTELTAITDKNIADFVSTEFGAQRAHLYVAGLFDSALIKQAITAEFGDWQTGPVARATQIEGSRQGQITFIDRPNATQTTLMFGLPVLAPKAPHFIDFAVTNTLFGGSLLSRLDQNLREDKGWTYGASSRITPYAAGIAIWTLATDVSTPDSAPAVQEIFKELARLRAEPATISELNSIQNYRAGTFVIGASSRGGIISQLAYLEQQQLPETWLTDYVAKVHAVTPEQVRAAALEQLTPEHMTLVVVGDLKSIKDPILALPSLQDIRIAD